MRLKGQICANFKNTISPIPYLRARTSNRAPRSRCISRPPWTWARGATSLGLRRELGWQGFDVIFNFVTKRKWYFFNRKLLTKGPGEVGGGASLAFGLRGGLHLEGFSAQIWISKRMFVLEIPSSKILQEEWFFFSGENSIDLSIPLNSHHLWWSCV